MAYLKIFLSAPNQPAVGIPVVAVVGVPPQNAPSDGSEAFSISIHPSNWFPH